MGSGSQTTSANFILEASDVTEYDIYEALIFIYCLFCVTNFFL